MNPASKHRNARRAYRSHLREKTPAQKLAMTAAAHRTARILARAGARSL